LNLDISSLLDKTNVFNTINITANNFLAIPILTVSGGRKVRRVALEK